MLDNVSHALTQASAGVAALSFDKKFLQRRRAAVAEEKRVSTISDGIRRAAFCYCSDPFGRLFE